MFVLQHLCSSSFEGRLLLVCVEELDATLLSAPLDEPAALSMLIPAPEWRTIDAYVPRLNVASVSSVMSLITHVSPSELGALAEVIHERTAGVMQGVVLACRQLYRDGHLYFSMDEGKWFIDEQAMLSLSASHWTTADSIQVILRNLPIATHRILCVIAQLGATVILSKVCLWLQQAVLVLTVFFHATASTGTGTLKDTGMACRALFVT